MARLFVLVNTEPTGYSGKRPLVRYLKYCSVVKVSERIRCYQYSKQGCESTLNHKSKQKYLFFEYVEEKDVFPFPLNCNYHLTRTLGCYYVLSSIKGLFLTTVAYTILLNV